MNGMTSEDIRLAKERVDLIDKIRKLDVMLGKELRKKQKDENKIEDLTSQIKYHIFAMNKITDKLYGSGENNELC